MWKRLVVVGLVGALLVGGIYSGEGAKPAAAEGVDFGGKVLMIVSKGGEAEKGTKFHYLESAKVRRLGDRYFLVGKYPYLNEYYKATKGCVVWRSLSDISDIVEYPNVEALKKHIEEMKEEKDKEK
jgi:hypothetical protein